MVPEKGVEVAGSKGARRRESWGGLALLGSVGFSSALHCSTDAMPVRRALVAHLAASASASAGANAGMDRIEAAWIAVGAVACAFVAPMRHDISSIGVGGMLLPREATGLFGRLAADAVGIGIGNAIGNSPSFDDVMGGGDTLSRSSGALHGGAGLGAVASRRVLSQPDDDDDLEDVEGMEGTGTGRGRGNAAGIAQHNDAEPGTEVPLSFRCLVAFAAGVIDGTTACSMLGWPSTTATNTAVHLDPDLSAGAGSGSLEGEGGGGGGAEFGNV